MPAADSIQAGEVEARGRRRRAVLAREARARDLSKVLVHSFLILRAASDGVGEVEGGQRRGGGAAVRLDLPVLAAPAEAAHGRVEAAEDADDEGEAEELGGVERRDREDKAYRSALDRWRGQAEP